MRPPEGPEVRRPSPSVPPKRRPSQRMRSRGRQRQGRGEMEVDWQPPHTPSTLRRQSAASLPPPGKMVRPSYGGRPQERHMICSGRGALQAFPRGEEQEAAGRWWQCAFHPSTPRQARGRPPPGRQPLSSCSSEAVRQSLPGGGSQRHLPPPQTGTGQVSPPPRAIRTCRANEISSGHCRAFLRMRLSSSHCPSAPL